MGWQELSWLGTAKPCSFCSQCNYSFTQCVSTVIRALDMPQIYANPVPAGKGLKRLEYAHPRVPANTSQMQVSWLLSQPPQSRLSKWTQSRPTGEGQAHQGPRNCGQARVTA